MNYKESYDAAIMFCDIVGSSTLYTQHGNEKAKQLVDQALSIMCSISEQLEGRIIKTLGDEAMLEFASAEQACEAAIAIGLSLRKIKIFMRTGIDFGEVLHFKKDAFGDTVNDAAFLAKLAQPNQIVLTSDLVETLPPWLSHQCEVLDRVQLKGVTEKTLVYRLAWDNKLAGSMEATQVSHLAPRPETKESPQLTVEVNGKLTALNANSEPLVIGRDPEYVDICMEDVNTSRRHCSIYFHHGKFILEDHSTNGCYLQLGLDDELYLRRESIPLTGTGRISLGQSFKVRGQFITFSESRETPFGLP